MPKGVKICLFIAVFLFVAAVAAVIIMSRRSDGQIVLVVQDNVVLRRIDLSAAADEIIRIEAPDGGYNLIEVKDGTVRISEADCPDKTCVKTGTLKYADIPVVCLPHHLVLRFDEEDGEG